MANPPSKLVIGPVTYELKVDASRTMEHDADGLHVFSTQEITLSGLRGPDVQRIDLLHEVLHGVVAVANVDISASKEETLISGMSAMLLGTLRANPKLVEYLLT